MAESWRLDLVRHGEPEGGGGRFLGREDEPLSPRGETQTAAALADLARWEEPGWDRVLSSPLRRCRLPAERFAAERGVALSLVPEWVELDFGAWEGCPVAAVHRDDARRLAAFWEDPWRHAPPGGESLADFTSRVRSGWRRLRAEVPGRRWLVFTHAGVMRSLLMIALELPPAALWRWRLDYGARLRLEAEPWAVSRLEGESP